jgi:hypothetical protein
MTPLHPPHLQRRRLLAGACAAACGALPVIAVANGVPPPAELASALAGASLTGSTRMRFFGLNVYDARLWTLPRFQPAVYWQHPLALELTYLRSLGGEAIAQRSLDEMRRNGPIPPDTAALWLRTMSGAFPDVATGDRITGLHTPSTGARFWHNGQLRATIPDPEFSRLFFGIWLSEKTSEPRLRAELLSGLTP